MSLRIDNLTPRKTVRYQTHTLPVIPPAKKEDKVVKEPDYKVGGETLIIVKDVEDSVINLDSTQNNTITIKSLTKCLVVPDLGSIDEEWDELLLEKGACVHLSFVEGNWYIISSDGLKLN